MFWSRYNTNPNIFLDSNTECLFFNLTDDKPELDYNSPNQFIILQGILSQDLNAYSVSQSIKNISATNKQTTVWSDFLDEKRSNKDLIKIENFS